MDYKSIVKAIIDEALSIKSFAGMPTEELVALSRLDVAIFMESSMRNDGLYKDEDFRNTLRALTDIVIDRALNTSDLRELSFLSPALFNITRTGLGRYKEERKKIDTKLVLGVLTELNSTDAMRRKPSETSKEDAYRPLHAAMTILRQEPLTTLTFDFTSPGNRRYNFSIGGELFADTLRSWADTQNADGSWSGIGLTEALSRIEIIEADFGSIEGIDNKKITNSAYNYYSKYPVTTATDLAKLYMANVCRWGYSFGDNDNQDFTSKAVIMLSNPSLTKADCHTLQYVIISTASDII